MEFPGSLSCCGKLDGPTWAQGTCSIPYHNCCSVPHTPRQGEVSKSETALEAREHCTAPSSTKRTDLRVAGSMGLRCEEARMFQTEASPARLGVGVTDPDKVTEKRPRECAHGGGRF